MLGCDANKALIAGVSPTVSAFLYVLEAGLRFFVVQKRTG